MLRSCIISLVAILLTAPLAGSLATSSPLVAAQVAVLILAVVAALAVIVRAVAALPREVVASSAGAAPVTAGRGAASHE